MIEWHPERRYSIAQIQAGLDLPPVPDKVYREAPPPSVEWTAKTPEQQQEAESHLCAALATIPADDRGLWVNVGHYLRTLPDEIGYPLFDTWSRKSDAFDEEGLFDYWGFAPTGCSYRSVFKLAESHGWVNPRKLDTATVFSAPVTVPAGASPVPRPPTEQRRALLPETPLDTARAVIQRRYSHTEGPCLKAWQSMFYRWEAASWIEMTEADMRAVLYAFLDSEGESGYKPTKARVGNLLDALKAAAHLDSTHEAPCWIAGTPAAPASELVACANGLLHLPTRRVLPATPRFFNLNAVPFEYAPAAPPPARWLQFLRTVWPNDPEAVSTLQELFGYLLTPDTSQQKIFLIVGPKRSGKGTIARVLADMLGSANVAGPTLSGLAETFGLQPLIGKQVAIVSDARLGGRTDAKQVAEHLLRISGEDRVEVGRKFLGSLTLKLGVRFVLLTNELPRIADASGAMASRFVILKMTEWFFGREDPGLTRKLLDELPGILAWAVDGWQRLNARGYFVEPKSSAEAAQDLADLGSPVAAFVRDECSIEPGLQISRDDIFSAWCIWCARQGMTNRSTKDTFGADLRAAFPEISDSRPRAPSGHPRPRFYVGIGHVVQPGPPDPPSRNLLGINYIN